MKNAYFPLRSSVELFQDPTSPAPVTRAKVAAILFDAVIFEAGLYEQTIGDHMAFGVTVEPTPERRKLARTVRNVGEDFQIGFGAQPGRGIPAKPEDMHVMSDKLAVQYSAEWHTDVIDELEVLEPNWAGSISSDDVIAEAQLQPELNELKATLEREVPRDDENWNRRKFTIDAMSRDTVVAAAMEATVNVTSLFEPLLSAVPDGVQDHPGETALWFAIRGIERLTWEEICEFRAHPGSEEARARLRTAEERVVATEGEQSPEFAASVGREITADLLAALNDARPDLAKELKEDAANIGVSFVPGVGPILSGVATVGTTLADAAEARRTWHAALMKLRPDER